ncbi:MAG: hypothetical protein IJU23_06155 [Proteobacteria bacterium]|nr:hypothetical protein [Pseudomonadota bacterium]
MKKSIIPLLGILAAMTGCASTQVNQATEVPVSRVVMYQSGIGYVERTGTVDTDELVLSIRPDQINDILKSLTVIDRGNGRPVSISLPVDRDTLDTLAEIPDQVQNGGIKSLLSAFRGAHVKLKTRGSSYEGRIVGVEEPKNKEMININSSGENADQLTTVTLLTDGNKLEIVRVCDVKSVDIYDRSLADGLDKSLNISLNEGDWKQVELRIRMDSAKSRELALSYLVAMPTWKPAYRLIIEDNDKGTLQGWAIISNVTGSDWDNISFSLVSGQPMSFTYDLYTPQFLERPDLSSLAETKAAAPKIVNSAMNAKPSRSAGYGLGATGVGGGGANLGSYAKKAAKAEARDLAFDDAMIEGELLRYDEAYDEIPEYEPIDSSEMIANFSELASKAQIGSFDEYRLASRLTIPDGNTALVNLIQSQLEARDTRLIEKPDYDGFDTFYKGWRVAKSYQTIELKNSSGVGLDAGPITIYRDSAVIGEGYLSRTEKDATAYITFANEGRLTVSVVDTTEERTYGLESFNGGVCKVSEELMLTQHFEFDSRINSQTTALLQLPQMTHWTPVDFPESAVKKSDGYVISVSVPADGKNVQPLTMKSKRMITYRTNMEGCLEGIRHSINAGEITGDLVDKFNRYVSDSEKKIANQDKLQVLKSRKNEIYQDQKQLTETIEGLKSIKSAKGDSLKNQLLDRQKANEKELAEITTEIYTLQVENGELELSLKELERTINYSRK